MNLQILISEDENEKNAILAQREARIMQLEGETKWARFNYILGSLGSITTLLAIFFFIWEKLACEGENCVNRWVPITLGITCLVIYGFYLLLEFTIGGKGRR